MKEKIMYMAAFEFNEDIGVRNGYAKNYPPHITVKSRFLSDNEDFSNIIDVVKPVKRFEVSVDKVEFPSEFIAWTKVNQGAGIIKGAHLQMLEIVNLSYENRTYEGYEGQGFIPHITLNWSNRPISNRNDYEKEVFRRFYVNKFSIYRFSKLMEKLPVETVCSYQLGIE